MTKTFPIFKILEFCPFLKIPSPVVYNFIYHIFDIKKKKLFFYDFLNLFRPKIPGQKGTKSEKKNIKKIIFQHFKNLVDKSVDNGTRNL